LIVTLLGADGQRLDEYSEPVYENRIRKILFIANSDGNYHLLLRPRLKDGAPGHYQLRVEIVRPATEPDQIRVRATQITKDANYTLGNVNPLSIEEAPKVAGKLEEALQLWQSLGDLRMVGESFLSLGNVNHRIGEFTKALGFYEKALALFPQTPEGVASKATALNNVANIYLSLGETRRALEVFLKSLELKKEEGRSRAITLDNIGAVYTLLGEYQLALDHHMQALASFRVLARRRDEAAALNNLAWLWESMGDPKRSAEHVLQALPLVKEAGDKAGEALYLSSAGHFYFLMGENRQALEYASQSYNLSRAINNRRAETASLTLLCRVYPSLGEFEKALDACNRVLQMSQDSRDRLHKATLLTALSRVFEQTGERRKAIESREAALANYRAIGDPTGELTTLHALGQLDLEGGDFLSARGKIERAVEMAESLRIKVGSHQLRATYMAGMQQVYESYVDLLMQMHGQEPGKGYEQTALQVSERARARSLLDLLGESHARIRQGADPALLEKERSLLERLNAKDDAWKKLRNNERTKKQAESIANEIKDLTTQLQLVESRIRSSSPRYAALTQPKPLSTTEIQQQILDENTVLLEYALGEKQSWLWTVTQDSISSYKLPPRAEIDTAARNLYELLTARQPKKDLTEAEQLKRIVEADARLQTATETLSRILLGPVSAQLQQEWKGKRLAVVTSGALEYTPFAALPLPAQAGDQPLIANHEVVNLPSASALVLIRREAAERQAATKILAVLADPVFEADDPRLAIARKKASANGLIASVRSTDSSSAASRLPSELARSVRSFHRGGFGRLVFSHEEADAITRLAPRNSTLKATGFAANRQLATSGELSRYRIVHFATHGLINSEHPELSGLVLSLVDETGKPQDGFLRMHELFNLQLPADLVVLSACQTALGKEIKGEGLVGLTRGFMYAGAE
ncbi:MAG: CHAT domain-containing protein, partial [Blastocatellia bacterium]